MLHATDRKKQKKLWILYETSARFQEAKTAKYSRAVPSDKEDSRILWILEGL